MFNVSKQTVPPYVISQWTLFPNSNAISGKVPEPKTNTSEVDYLGDFRTRDGCWAACNASKSCASFTWHSTAFEDPAWATGCYGLKGSAWQEVEQDGVISGRGPHSSAFYRATPLRLAPLARRHASMLSRRSLSRWQMASVTGSTLAATKVVRATTRPANGLSKASRRNSTRQTNSGTTPKQR